MESIQTAQILIPNGIRLMIFDYFSTKQLLMKVSALSQKTRTQLFSSPIKRDTVLEIPSSIFNASALLNLIKLSKNITVKINENSNLYNLHYILMSIPESMKKDHTSLDICNFDLELVTVLSNFRDYIFDQMEISEADSQMFEKLELKCNKLDIYGFDNLKMSLLAKFDQRNKLKAIGIYQSTFQNDTQSYKFEKITNLQIVDTEINLDLSNHFDFSIIETYVFANNANQTLDMLINSLSQLKKVDILYLDYKTFDVLNYQQVLRSLATNEKIINELRFPQDKISIKLSEILQEYSIKQIKDGQLTFKALTVDNLYVGDRTFKGKIIKGYKDLNIIQMDYFRFFMNQNVNTKNIAIKIKDEETGHMLFISALKGEINLPQPDEDE